MTLDPTPRAIAIRLITAWLAGPDVYRRERDALALSPAEAGALINDLVHIAGLTVGLLTDQREVIEEPVAAADLLLFIERALDQDERRSTDG